MFLRRMMDARVNLLVPLHMRSRVQRASGIPCALSDFEGETIRKTSGKSCRENAKVRLDEMAPKIQLVMPGLDPGIHHSSQEHFLRRWIAGSSPAMTEPSRPAERL